MQQEHLLIVVGDTGCNHPDWKFLQNNFIGKVIKVKQSKDVLNFIGDAFIFVCGDISDITMAVYCHCLVIKELSVCSDTIPFQYLTSTYAVPIKVGTNGVFIRKCFDKDCNYFARVTQEHKLQSLTESNKPNSAFRKGIYLSKVTVDGKELHFNLLRCSSNLDGPTDNFRDSDDQIIKHVNATSQRFFNNPAPLNHVLAQVYYNQNNRKARIAAHSDKTKDMPSNGVMAFCTFYDELKISKDMGALVHDPLDYGYKGKSALTRLRFQTKPDTPADMKDFTVTLYPESLLLIPLSTNRIYTHAIVPSELPASFLPTRLGYVIRCSKTKAVFVDNQTYVLDNSGQRTPLHNPTEEEIKHLKNLYYQENATCDVVDYGDLYFSLNSGDYKSPIA